jgi:arginase family enzyme
MNNKISLIGAPTDVGAGTRGCSMGPEALRVANIVPLLEGRGLEVEDRPIPGRILSTGIVTWLPWPNGTSWCMTRYMKN